MKKIVSLTIATIMVLSLALSASATEPAADSLDAGEELSTIIPFTLDPETDGSGETVTATVPRVSSGKINGMAGDISAGCKNGTDLGEIAPNEARTEYITLYDTFFTWDDGFVPDEANPAKLTAAQIRNAKLSVRSKSSKVVKDVTLNARESRVEVEFIKEHVSTKELDFEVEIYLLIDGKRQNDSTITLSGTIANPVLEVYAEEEEADISDGAVIEAMEYNSKINLDLGNDVILTTKLFKGKFYYGTAGRTPEKVDEEVMDKYKDIEVVIILKTVGFGSSSDTVRLGREYKDHYIYDGDLNYLGRGNDSLPFASRYYAAKVKLSVAEETLPPAPAGNSESSEPPKNTEAQTVENQNHNPNTGR